jgi:hypothetical protein
MPFESRGDVALSALVKLRLTPEEKERLRDESELAGLTMSEFVRRRAFGRPVVAATDLVMVRELRRVGGLLKLVHSESQGAYSERTMAALSDLRACIARVGKGE